MRIFKFFAYALFVLFLGVTMSSCKGDDGADGIDGIDGTIGPAGQDGNANVIYSDWIMPTWTASTYYGVQVQEYYITTTDLSLDVVNYGVVLMYWKNWNNDIWSLPSSGFGGNIIIDFTFTENSIYLYIFDEINGTLPPAIDSANVFRYVIIPGNIPGKSSSDSLKEIYIEFENAGVDINDYYDVCDYYGINP